MYSIIYVNYINSEQTIESVNFFKNSVPHANVKIYIVDNGSGAARLEMLNNAFGDDASISILPLTENKGFAAGVNAGLACAREGGHNFHFIANPDTRFDRSACEGLICDSHNYNVEIISPIIVNEKGKVDRNILRHRRTNIGYLTGIGILGMFRALMKKSSSRAFDFGKLDAQNDGFILGDVISGAFFGVRDGSNPAVTLDSDLFLYLEEYALAEQNHEFGRKTGVSYRRKVVHLSNKKSGDQSVSTKLKLERESLRVFLKKYRKMSRPYIELIILNLWLYHLALILRRRF